MNITKVIHQGLMKCFKIKILKGDLIHMKNGRKLMLCIFVVSMLGATVGQAIALEPKVETVSLNPSNPTVQSTVTVTATISGDDIEAVHFTYKECDPEICKFTKNISLIETSGGIYEATFTLTYDKATYITYYFNIQSAGGWTKTDDVDVTLLPKQNGDSNGNGDNKTPGFELVVVLAAVGILMILFGKKRYI